MGLRIILIDEMLEIENNRMVDDLVVKVLRLKGVREYKLVKNIIFFWSYSSGF